MHATVEQKQTYRSLILWERLGSNELKNMSNNDITEQKSSSAKIHGQSGSLKELLNKLDSPKIKDLKDILQFKKNYAVIRQKKINDSIAEIKLQISELIVELNKLKDEKDIVIKSKSEEQSQTIACLEGDLVDPHQHRSFFTVSYFKIKRWAQEKRIKQYKKKSQKSITVAIEDYAKRIAGMVGRINDTNDRMQALAEERISSELSRMDAINSAIEKEKYLFYGAIGEAKVLEELKRLPETYHVINDLNIEFNRPLYNRAEDDRIYSVQVDHLVVGPSGVFVIETKYWSHQSISNEMLFSPVKQVKRAGFALFIILNDAIKSKDIMRLVNHWGERKISPRQIVASVNNAPHADFQYVKVLSVEKLNSYITYGKQLFTTEEIEDMVGFLLKAG